MKRPIIETERLVLRPLTFSDYDEWYKSWAKCGPAKNSWDHGPLKNCERKVFLNIIKKHKMLANKDEYYYFAAFEKKSGHYIGHVDIDVFVRRIHQFANFGYILHNPYWGQGFGREMAKKGLEIGFKYLLLNRLEASINLDNEKSKSLAESIGMKFEGIKRRYWFEDDGKWTDQAVYIANPEDIGLIAHKPF